MQLVKQKQAWQQTTYSKQLPRSSYKDPFWLLVCVTYHQWIITQNCPLVEMLVINHWCPFSVLSPGYWQSPRLHTLPSPLTNLPGNRFHLCHVFCYTRKPTINFWGSDEDRKAQLNLLGNNNSVISSSESRRNTFVYVSGSCYTNFQVLPCFIQRNG